MEYIKHRSTIFSFLSDLIILSGLFFFNWNSTRIMIFICLDIEVMIFFFFIFMKFENEINNYFSLLIGFILLSSLMYVYFLSILSIPSEFFQTRPVNIKTQNVIDLFYPFYDLATFLVLSGTGHFIVIRKLTHVINNTDSEWFSMKSVIYRMLMVPVTLLIGGWIALLLRSNILTTSCIFFLIVKDITEYWKFQALMKMKITTDE